MWWCGEGVSVGSELEATTVFFSDRPRPDRIRLHLVRDEFLQVA